MLNKIVVYSNTDYCDILKIETDYILKNKNNILFINKNTLNLQQIYSSYQEVVFYDNNLPYSSRLLQCLEQIKEEHILLTHDIDIVLSMEQEKIENLKNLMIEQNLDRIDLKHSNKTQSDSYIELDKNCNLSRLCNTTPNCEMFLMKQNDINNYIFNVNPSIWKVSTLKNILKTFPEKTYRNIEDLDVQYYCRKFNIYKIFSNNYIKCGYYNCLDFYKFLHITHSGKILSLNKECVTEYGQSYKDVESEFHNIIKKYDLKNSNKWRS